MRTNNISVLKSAFAAAIAAALAAGVPSDGGMVAESYTTRPGRPRGHPGSKRGFHRGCFGKAKNRPQH